MNLRAVDQGLRALDASHLRVLGALEQGSGEPPRQLTVDLAELLEVRSGWLAPRLGVLQAAGFVRPCKGTAHGHGRGHAPRRAWLLTSGGQEALRLARDVKRWHAELLGDYPNATRTLCRHLEHVDVPLESGTWSA